MQIVILKLVMLILGNMTVINANYNVKTAITWDMKNSLTRVSYDLVRKILVWPAYEGFLKCQFLNF